MTDDRMALAQLLEKGSDADLLRKLVGTTPGRVRAAKAISPATGGRTKLRAARA